MRVGIEGYRLVFIHKDRFHRRDAKNAKKFFNKNNQTLRALCGFAVSYSLMDGHWLAPFPFLLLNALPDYP
jgi:hypothetical protein